MTRHDRRVSSEPAAQAPVEHGVHLPDWRPAAVGVLASMAVLGGALAELPWLWIPVVAVQLAVVTPWHRLAGVGAALPGALVGAGLATIVDVVIANTEDAPSLGPIAVVLGAGYLVAVVQQLARRDGRTDLVDSLSTTIGLATIAAFGAAWVVVAQLPGGPDASVVLAGACAAAAVGRLAPGLAGAVVVPMVSGVVGGTLLGVAVDDVGRGASLGVAAGVATGLAAAVQVRLPSADRGWLLSGTWPVLLAAPLGYCAVRLVG